MSNRRTGFVLDAHTMGISNPQPAHARCDQEGNPQPEPQQQPEARPRKPVSAYLSGIVERVASTSSLFTPHSDVAVPPPTPCRAMHGQCNSSTDTIATSHYRSRLNRLRELCTSDMDAATINLELNSIFLKRLDEIDNLDKERGDGASLAPQLRLVTFQEWVDLLLDVNTNIFGNIFSLEEEAHAKITACFQSVRGEQQQELEENRKLRRDMCAIIRFVQNAYQKKCWNTSDLCLETMSVYQLLGIPRGQIPPESECEKMSKDLSSLANEVAAKHDEVCRLQAQLCNRDEVVQTAHQKLMLKDECIAQLNKQLLELQDCVSNLMNTTRRQAQPVSIDTQSEMDSGINSDVNTVPSDVLNTMETSQEQAKEMLNTLRLEMQEVFDLVEEGKREAARNHQERFHMLFQKIKDERCENLRKLENIRALLLQGLESEVIGCDDTSQSTSGEDVPESDAESLAEFERIGEALRVRLVTLQCANKDLECRNQRLASDMQELRINYQKEQSFNVKQAAILKEAKELLCKLLNKDIPCESIYCEEQQQLNPICAAIMEIHEKTEMQQQSELQIREYANINRKPSTHTFTQNSVSSKANIKAKSNSSYTTKTTTTAPRGKGSIEKPAIRNVRK